MSRRRSHRRSRRFVPSSDLDCYSILEFCRRHGISRPHFYRLREQGLTPVEFRLGARVLITREAAEAWRRERSRPSKHLVSAITAAP
jgi:predicted DNA-binding transcriptional regulator AlpA